MTAAERVREILKPEQAADYLQVKRETFYRYICDGMLLAEHLLTLDKRLIRWVARARLPFMALAPEDFIEEKLPTHADFSGIH